MRHTTDAPHGGAVESQAWLKARQRASSNFDEVKPIFDENTANLIQRLELLGFEPERILQLGAWDCALTDFLRARYPNAQILVLEPSLGFIHRLSQNDEKTHKNNNVKIIQWVSGSFPVADASVDLFISEQGVPPYAHWNELLAECRRVLAPRGYLSLATLGDRSFLELKAALDDPLKPSHVYDFIDIQSFGMALVSAGFTDPVVDTERVELQYRTLDRLRRDFQALGLGNYRQDRRRSLHKDPKFVQLINFKEASPIPMLTLELLYAQGFSPTGLPVKKVKRTEQVLPFPTRKARIFS